MTNFMQVCKGREKKPRSFLNTGRDDSWNRENAVRISRKERPSKEFGGGQDLKKEGGKGFGEEEISLICHSASLVREGKERASLTMFLTGKKRTLVLLGKRGRESSHKKKEGEGRI